MSAGGRVGMESIAFIRGIITFIKSGEEASGYVILAIVNREIRDGFAPNGLKYAIC